MVAAAEVEEGLMAVEMFIVDICQIVVDHFHHLSGGSVIRGGTLGVWVLRVVIRANVAVHIPLLLLPFGLVRGFQ